MAARDRGRLERDLAAIAAARDALEQAQARFIDAVRTAHKRGTTVRAIAPAAALSRSRVHQLLSDDAA